MDCCVGVKMLQYMVYQHYPTLNLREMYPDENICKSGLYSAFAMDRVVKVAK